MSNALLESEKSKITIKAIVPEWREILLFHSTNLLRKILLVKGWEENIYSQSKIKKRVTLRT